MSHNLPFLRWNACGNFQEFCPAGNSELLERIKLIGLQRADLLLAHVRSRVEVDNSMATTFRLREDPFPGQEPNASQYPVERNELFKTV